jgi:methyl-accepting chemotaxis protein
MLNNLSIRLKLSLAPAVCLFLLGMCTAGALWGFALQRSAMDALHEKHLPSYLFVARFESGLREMNGQINRSLGYEAMGYNAKEIAEIDKALTLANKDLRQALSEREAAGLSDSERQALEQMKGAFVGYESAIKEVLDMRSAGPAIASTYLTLANKSYEVLLREIQVLSKRELERAEGEVSGAQVAALRGQAVIAVAAALALLLGIGLSLMLARGMLSRMQLLSGSMAALAAGDLGKSLQSQGTDEIGALLRDAESVRLRLSDSLRLVHSAATSVQQASSEIAAGNTDLSHRTEQQASNLQQTAASMGQLSTAVRTSADTAQQANQLAGSASEAAAIGGKVVDEVVKTMEAITESSRRISDIIGTIDSIAFQTNILALNAAVEAARAGEQGRGFAVVASEVRALAQRSAAAAREIKTLINDSAEKVDEGARLVGEAGSSMDNIVSQVKRVSDLISEISSAAGEQTDGIEQVSGAVTQLDIVTQQNAALVEQSAAAAESLQRQAVQLVEAVSAFRLAPS